MTAARFSRENPPFELSRDSVLKGSPLKIGDLSFVSELKANSTMKGVSLDPTLLERCLQVGSDWLRRSDDGTRLELTQPWGSPPRQQLVTAYCTDCAIIAGGYSQQASGEGGDRRVLFFIADSGPATLVLRREFAVESSDSYTLNEIREIDPVSGRILFAATSEDGEEALLAAPFAVTPRVSPACPGGLATEE